jgi:hypothetical protein
MELVKECLSLQSHPDAKQEINAEDFALHHWD